MGYLIAFSGNPPGNPTSSSTLAVVRLGGENYAQTHLPSYGYVIGGVGKVSDLPYVKSRSSTAKVLLWTDILSIINNDSSNPTSVNALSAVDRAECLASETLPTDPWVLRDAGSGYIAYNGYSNENFANPGSANYQNTCLTRLTAKIDGVTGDGGYSYDGFMLDNIFPSYYTTSGGLRSFASAASALYPVGSGADKDENWRPAILSLVQNVLGPLKAAGHYIAVNSAHPDELGNPGEGWTKSTTWWTSIQSYVNCVNVEYFMQKAGGASAGELAYNGLSGVGQDDFNSRLGFQQTLNSVGLDLFAGVHWEILKRNGSSVTDAAGLATANMYLRSAFLLEWNGTGGGGYRMQQTGSLDPWDAKWTVEIGSPTGAKYAVLTDGWRRDYANGTVIVNPKAYGAGNITFSLGGNYIDSSGATVSSVTLAPVTAMILTKAP